MSMTPEQIAAERERFEDVAPTCGFPCPKPVVGMAYTYNPTPFAYASTNDGWQLWQKRAEIANAEKAELVAENATLRERGRELAKARIREIVSRDADSSFPLWSRGWWSVACDERSGAWLMQLAEQAGVWFDDEGNEVPIAEWREQQGGVG